MDEVYEKINTTEIFNNEVELDTIVWYLLYLLGGKVVIPTDEEFWINAVPEDGDRRVVLRKEDGQLVLVAEALSWS